MTSARLSPTDATDGTRGLPRVTSDARRATDATPDERSTNAPPGERSTDATLDEGFTDGTICEGSDEMRASPSASPCAAPAARADAGGRPGSPTAPAVERACVSGGTLALIDTRGGSPGGEGRGGSTVVAATRRGSRLTGAGSRLGASSRAGAGSRISPCGVERRAAAEGRGESVTSSVGRKLRGGGTRTGGDEAATRGGCKKVVASRPACEAGGSSAASVLTASAAASALMASAAASALAGPAACSARVAAAFEGNASATPGGFGSSVAAWSVSRRGAGAGRVASSPAPRRVTWGGGAGR